MRALLPLLFVAALPLCALDHVEYTQSASRGDLAAALLRATPRLTIIPSSVVVTSRLTAGQASISFANGIDLGMAGSTAMRLVAGNGVLITSGDGTPPGSNTASGYGVALNLVGDSTLQQTLRQVTGDNTLITRDANVITFQFTVEPGMKAVAFEFMFGSDEYPEYADSNYVDGAAVYIDGVNYAYYGTPDKILTVRNNLIGGDAIYIANSGTTALPSEYDGITKPARAIAPLDLSRSIHTCKIVIADTGDMIFDSGLYLGGMTARSATGSGTGIDLIAPSATLAALPGSVGTTFPLSIAFSEAVYDFSGSALTITNGTVIGTTPINDLSYTVTVQATNDGPLTAILAAGSYEDVAGNPGKVSNTVSTTAVVPPVVTIVPPATVVNGAATWQVTFSEPVSGLTVSDFSVVNGSVTNVAGSGTAWTVTVTPTADPVSVALNAGAVLDSSGNGNGVNTAVVVAFDNTPPVGTITAPTTSSGPFTIIITFTEPVVGLTLDDLVVVNGVISALNGSGATYSATVTPSTDGPTTVTLAAGAVTDIAGNGTAAPSVTPAVAVNILPTVTITGPTGIVDGSFTVTILFSEPITGFTLADVTATNAALTALTMVNVMTYTVTVNPLVAGPVSVTVAGGIATDSAGNANLAATSALAVVFDPLPPGIVLSATATSPVTGAFTVILTSSELVTGLEPADLVTTGSVAVRFTALGGNRWEILLRPFAGVQSCSIQVKAGAAMDGAGLPSAASNLLTMAVDAAAVASQDTSSVAASNGEDSGCGVGGSMAAFGLLSLAMLARRRRRR